MNMHKQSSESTSSSVERVSNIKTSFPAKLFDVLANPRFAHMVAWEPEGTSFCILKPREFCKFVVPAIFKVDYKTFTRGLNHWGFQCVERRLGNDGDMLDVLSHPLFSRECPTNVAKMTAKARSQEEIKRSIEEEDGDAEVLHAEFKRPKLEPSSTSTTDTTTDNTTTDDSIRKVSVGDNTKLLLLPKKKKKKAKKTNSDLGGKEEEEVHVVQVEPGPRKVPSKKALQRKEHQQLACRDPSIHNGTKNMAMASIVSDLVAPDVFEATVGNEVTRRIKEVEAKRQIMNDPHLKQVNRQKLLQQAQQLNDEQQQHHYQQQQQRRYFGHQMEDSEQRTLLERELEAVKQNMMHEQQMFESRQQQIQEAKAEFDANQQFDVKQQFDTAVEIEVDRRVKEVKRQRMMEQQMEDSKQHFDTAVDIEVSRRIQEVKHSTLLEQKRQEGIPNTMLEQQMKQVARNRMMEQQQVVVQDRLMEQRMQQANNHNQRRIMEQQQQVMEAKFMQQRMQGINPANTNMDHFMTQKRIQEATQMRRELEQQQQQAESISKFDDTIELEISRRVQQTIQQQRQQRITQQQLNMMMGIPQERNTPSRVMNQIGGSMEQVVSRGAQGGNTLPPQQQQQPMLTLMPRPPLDQVTSTKMR